MSARTHFLGYQVVSAGLEACVAELMEAVTTGARRQWFACINPHSYVVAIKDAEFRAALQWADLLIPDGVGIVMASRVLGAPIRGRVTGPEVFVRLMSELNRRGGRSVYFLGGKIENLHRVAARVERDYPSVRVAGCYSPPFRETFAGHELDAMVNAVNAARPDVVWVSLTAPKQEKLIASQIARFDTAVLGAVGAALDFYSGAVALPPAWVQRAGLGWLHRFAQEPRRLWRRNFVSTPLFLLSIAVAAVKQRFSRVTKGGSTNGNS